MALGERDENELERLISDIERKMRSHSLVLNGSRFGRITWRFQNGRYDIKIQPEL